MKYLQILSKKTVFESLLVSVQTMFNEFYLFFEKARAEFRKSDDAHMYQHKTLHIHQHTCWSKPPKNLFFLLIVIMQIFEKNLLFYNRLAKTENSVVQVNSELFFLSKLLHFYVSSCQLLERINEFLGSSNCRRFSGNLMRHGTFRMLHKFGFPAQIKTKFFFKIYLNRLLTSSS